MSELEAKDESFMQALSVYRRELDTVSHATLEQRLLRVNSATHLAQSLSALERSARATYTILLDQTGGSASEVKWIDGCFASSTLVRSCYQTNRGESRLTANVDSAIERTY